MREFPEATSPEGKPLAVVGIYASRTEAYDRALVLSALQMPHWILRWEEDRFALCLRPADAEAGARELAIFEAERDPPPPPPPVRPAKHSAVSLYAYAALLSCVYAAQSARALDRGAAESRAILHGEWWRTLTALTLHADLEHLGSNLGAGLVCAAYLLPIFGTGWTWLLLLLAGGAANALNAWGHRGQDYSSIGASTAVFAALGLLAAAQCVSLAAAGRRLRLRDFLVPLGGAVGFLGLMGADLQTDYTGHLCGLLSGLVLGSAAAAGRLGERSPPWLQTALAGLVWLLLGAAWGRALA